MARVLRQTTGRKDEAVALITSAPPERLAATQWLLLNRQGWGIESGLHQRLDVSYNDDVVKQFTAGADRKECRKCGAPLGQDSRQGFCARCIFADLVAMSAVPDAGEGVW